MDRCGGDAHLLKGVAVKRVIVDIFGLHCKRVRTNLYRLFAKEVRATRNDGGQSVCISQVVELLAVRLCTRFECSAVPSETGQT